MTATTYAIRCTPGGGLLRDDHSGNIIYFDDYADAEVEALRLTEAGYSNPRVAGFDYVPVEVNREHSSE
jgi:hypothetical protein